MSEYNFIETRTFTKHWYALGLTDEELLRLQHLLIKGELRYDVIPHSGGIRKVRFPINKRGKRGGVRIIHLDIVLYETSVLLDVYSKSDLSKLNNQELKLIRQLADEIRKRLEDGKR